MTIAVTATGIVHVYSRHEEVSAVLQPLSREKNILFRACETNRLQKGREKGTVERLSCDKTRAITARARQRNETPFMLTFLLRVSPAGVPTIYTEGGGSGVQNQFDDNTANTRINTKCKKTNTLPECNGQQVPGKYCWLAIPAIYT